MILTCPSCGTQYVVKDGAIPPGGRQVRCASCKHSWHQEADAIGEGEASLAEPQPDPEPDLEQAPHEEDESLAEATLIEPRSGPEAEERAYEETVVEAEAVPIPAESQDDEFSPFAAADDDFEPRGRNPLLMILLVIVVVAALAAAFWFFAPDEWKVRLGIAAARASPLALVTTHMDRQRLESGNELLTVTGRVINPTAKEQDVPPLQAQLRSRTGQIVYKWTIAPPSRTLPPGGSASFNSAEVNVPPGSDELTITVGPPNA
jgi:predicted Zn finger-like uncharacterized protein